MSLEPAVFGGSKRVMLTIQHEIDALGRRRPQAKRGAVGSELRAEMSFIHAEPEKTSPERGGAVVSLPEEKPAAVCLTSAVFNSCCQLAYSGTFGSVN